MSIKPHFVSLSAVIDAIAREIEPPQPWQEGINKEWLQPSEHGAWTAEQLGQAMEISNAKTLLSLFVYAHQYSQAAAILDASLQNALGQQPRWFDVAVTGLPRR